MHRIIWFFALFITGVFVYRYLSEPDYEEHKGKDGKTILRKMTKWEQVGVVIKSGFGVAIIGALVWSIGYGVACWFEWKSDFWEMHLLYGVLTVAAVILLFIAIMRFWYFCNDFYHNRYGVRDYAKSLVMWIFIALCGLCVIGVILYYLFPLALIY